MTTTLGTGEVERGCAAANDARSCRSSRSPCHRGCGTGFFVIPLVFIVVYSFGTKVQGRPATST